MIYKFKSKATGDVIMLGPQRRPAAAPAGPRAGGTKGIIEDRCHARRPGG
jgi:hypothetical protein